MAEEKPGLHIDTDWKKQAQEEKRRLAEQEELRRQQAPAGPAGVVSGGGPAQQPPAGRVTGGRARQLPPATMDTLVQSIVTQVLLYLGELAAPGGEPMINLDLAKHHVDTLGMLEQKTRNNLTPEEKQSLDAALYEVRMRYISAASRQAELP